MASDFDLTPDAWYVDVNACLFIQSTVWTSDMNRTDAVTGAGGGAMTLTNAKAGNRKASRFEATFEPKDIEGARQVRSD